MHYQTYQRDPLAYIQRMHGGDPDLTAHLKIITNFGQVLIGPAISRIFGRVPDADYWQSIVYDLADARVMIGRQPVYVILNLCRAVAFREAGLILSKLAGGQYGCSRLPQYRSLIQQALQVYLTGQKQVFETSELVGFAENLLKRLKIE